MKVQHNGTDFDVMTYRSIRRAIGYLAISLPILLLSLSFFHFFDTRPQPSISHYYFTNLREIFTGTLFAVGLFLIRYKGHSNPSLLKNDKLLTNIAGIMAIGVALVPTNTLDNKEPYLREIHDLKDTLTLLHYPLGWLHYTFAAILFLILALLAINVFTIGQEKEINTPKSILDENNIYKFCGYSILLFIVLIPLFTILKLDDSFTLLFEALSLFAFGIAWLIKGRALGDKGVIGRKLYGENNPIDTEKVFEE